MLKYEDFIKENPNLLKLDPTDFPEDLNISTITLVCKVPSCFNTLAIAKYFPLFPNLIQTVKCGKNGEYFRSLNPDMKKRIQRKKVENKMEQKGKSVCRNFYNQVTIVVETGKCSKISVKLFNNGSIQLTGCKNISTSLWALNEIFRLLKQPLPENIVCDEKEEKSYVPLDVFLNISDLYDFHIVMINSDFRIGFSIDREKLFHLLQSEKYTCSYDASRYAGVIIRHISDSQKLEQNAHEISIMVFSEGAIIITGSLNFRQLIESYKFINSYLLENYVKIFRQKN